MDDTSPLDQRWGFLVPWCEALNRRFDFNSTEYEDTDRDEQTRRLQVTLPSRRFCCDEESFQTKFQQVREALALLSAVAHVDHAAWKYLLSRYCGVDQGKEGSEIFEEEIPARFLLILDLEERRIRENDDSVDSDLVAFCGTRQRGNQSQDYLEALEKIAAVRGGKEKELDIQIPVRVLFPARNLFSAVVDRPVGELAIAARAERAIKSEWEMYEQRLALQRGAPGFHRCTFVLEPMIADFSNRPVRPDVVEIMKTLIRENVWFSRATISLSKVLGNPFEAELLGQLAASVFDSTRRSSGLANTRYLSQLDPCGSLQLGTVVVHCEPAMRASEFQALCSAIVVSQTAKRLSLSLWLNPSSSAARWKWLAYALFSKRARCYSAVESLTLTSIGTMSTADMAAFSATLASKHPEEELFGCTPGQIGARDATLAAGAGVRYLGDDEAHTDGETLVFESPVPFVRSFSDDGESEWVDIIVPGYGRCRARRGDLSFDEANLLQESQGGITSLTVGFSDFKAQIMDGLPHLLATIGTNLKVLALDAMNTEVDIDLILGYCPNLEELSLRSAVVDLRLSFTSDELNHYRCKRLGLNWKDATSVVAELEDLHSPFSMCVRRVRLHLDSMRNTRTEPVVDRVNTLLTQLLLVLQANQRLGRCHCSCPIPP